MKTIYIACVGLFTATLALCQTEQDKKADEAESFFKKSTVINFNQKQDPYDLIGALIYYKDPNRIDWEYISLIPVDDRYKLLPKYNHEIVYQSMVSYEVAVKVKYLGFISAEMTNKNYVEVVLEDFYDLVVDNFVTNDDFKKKIFSLGAILKKQGYKVEFVDKLNLTTLKTRKYTEDKKEAGIVFIDAKGTEYSQSSDFTAKKIISLHSIDVTPFLDDTKPLGENKILKDLGGLIKQSSDNKTPTIKGLNKSIF